MKTFKQSSSSAVSPWFSQPRFAQISRPRSTINRSRLSPQPWGQDGTSHWPHALIGIRVHAVTVRHALPAGAATIRADPNHHWAATIGESNHDPSTATALAPPSTTVKHQQPISTIRWGYHSRFPNGIITMVNHHEPSPAANMTANNRISNHHGHPEVIGLHQAPTPGC